MNKRTTLALILTLLLSLALCSCTTNRPGDVPRGLSTDTSLLIGFQQALATGNGMTLLEGLPNENTEAKLFRAEKKDNPTVERQDFLFYPAPISPSSADAAKLAAALGDPAAIQTYSRGMKLCGGFHPDFAILWNDAAGAPYEAQVCFGCEEIKFFSNQSKLYADLAPQTFAALRDVLRHYGKFAVQK